MGQAMQAAIVDATATMGTTLGAGGTRCRVVAAAVHQHLKPPSPRCGKASTAIYRNNESTSLLRLDVTKE